MRSKPFLRTDLLRGLDLENGFFFLSAVATPVDTLDKLLRNDIDTLDINFIV